MSDAPVLDGLEGRDLTGLLNAWAEGDQGARDSLFEVVYPEIKAIALRFRSRRGDLTLQATEVVHEAYLKLLDQQSSGWRHRAQFFKLAAQVVRQVVVDNSRRRGAQKRGGAWVRSDVDPEDLPAATVEVDLVALDEALARLAHIDPETAQLVELRYFAGLTIPDTAEVLGVGTATVSRRWQLAQAWLRQELSASGT